MSEEEDLAVLIYKSSKTAKARAAAAAAKEERQMNASSTERRTSTRKRSSSNQDNDASMDRPRKKRTASWKYKARGKSICSADECTNIVINRGVCRRHGAKTKICSSAGCTHQVIKGGVCVRHGAKTKICSSAGCTNKSKRGGVCWRHGANRTHDGSTAFGSEYEKTTATVTLPHQRTAGASDEVSAKIPGEVVICQEIVEV